MAKTKKPQLEIRKKRIFSEEFKRQKIQQIVEKTISIADLTELYGMTRVTVYRWLYQYSPHHQKGTNQVVQMESEEHKTKRLLQQVAELERSVGQKQLCIDYLDFVKLGFLGIWHFGLYGFWRQYLLFGGKEW